MQGLMYPVPQMTSPIERLNHWLETLVGRKGSDLLLIPGAPASIRMEGGIEEIDGEILDGTEIEGAVLPALTAHGLEQYRQGQIADSSYRIPEVGRFRQ